MKPLLGSESSIIKPLMTAYADSVEAIGLQQKIEPKQNRTVPDRVGNHSALLCGVHNIALLPIKVRINLFNQLL